MSEREALYDLIIGEVFRRLREPNPRLEALDFDKDFIEQTMGLLVREGRIPQHVKNIPDIKYTYDARKDFPEPISRTGYWATVGRGKSKYRFVRLPHNNLLPVPASLPKSVETSALADKTPALVARVLGDDEQATLARLEYNGVVGAFTGLTAMRVQGHERTTVSAGQIEVDEVYVGEDRQGQHYVLPISAKGGGKDSLSYTQALNLNMYAAEKERYRGLKCRPLGVTRDDDGSLYLVEFSNDLDIVKIRLLRARRYVFRRQ